MRRRPYFHNNERRSKHMRRWLFSQGGVERPALTPVPTLGGRVVDGGKQYAVESKDTAPRPWAIRARNRRRAKAARKSRIANAQRAKR